MWTCSKCEIQIEDQFDACWRCGCNQNGELENGFRHADDFLPGIPDRMRHFKIAELFLFSSAIALALAGWKTENAILLMAGIATLALTICCRIIPMQIHNLQRQIRNAENRTDEAGFWRRNLIGVEILTGLTGLIAVQLHLAILLRAKKIPSTFFGTFESGDVGAKISLFVMLLCLASVPLFVLNILLGRQRLLWPRILVLAVFVCALGIALSFYV